MNDWWGTLSPVEHVLWVIAVAATTVLLVQLVIACFVGLDVDIDGNHDVGHHDIGGPHFQLLTVRGLVAFFSVFGWSGLAFNSHGHSLAVVLTMAMGCGLIMMFATALIFWGLANLQSIPSMDFSKAKGQFATVYLTIPPSGKGEGKITLTLQNKRLELNAVTIDITNEIPTGASVVIKDVINNQTVIVERV